MLFMLLVFGCSGSADTVPDGELTPKEVIETRWAWNTVNLREGPSTDDSIVGQLQRGDSVVVVNLVDGWWEIRNDSLSPRYVADRVIHDGQAPPLPDVVGTWEAEISEGLFSSLQIRASGRIRSGVRLGGKWKELLGDSISGELVQSVSDAVTGYWEIKNTQLCLALQGKGGERELDCANYRVVRVRNQRFLYHGSTEYYEVK